LLRALTMRNNKMFSASFWRIEEHWKPGCMVSCRTVQGRKRCAKDKRNQRRTELIRGRLAPRVLLCTAISRAPRGQVAQIPSFEVVHDFNGGGNASGGGWRSLLTLHLNTCHNFKGDFADLIATYRFGKAKQGHERPSPR
jgi:hypothetical protein